MIKYVFKCYDEYMKFMGIAKRNMPKICPVIFDSVNASDKQKRAWAYINSDEIVENIVKLNISSNLKNMPQDFQRQILFHEFTHILDANIFFSKYRNNRIFQNVMSTFSEYHAAQIEVSRGVGLKSWKIERKEDLENLNLMHRDKKMRIEERYLQSLADALVVIDCSCDSYYELSAVEYFFKYSCFEVNTMNYLGIYHFCTRISNKKIPSLIDTVYTDFAPYIRQIETDILEGEFEKLVISRNNLWKYYKSHFSCKEQFILPEKL